MTAASWRINDTIELTYKIDSSHSSTGYNKYKMLAKKSISKMRLNLSFLNKRRYDFAFYVKNS